MDALEEYLIGGEAKATPPTKPELKLVPDARPVFNPGNLRPSGSATGFQQFKTPEEGISAVDKNLQSYGKKGINTLRDVISTWAPPSENDTNAYIKNASQRIGIDPDAPIDLSDPVQRHLVSAAIISHEQGPRNIFAKRQTAIQAQQTGETLDPLEEYLTGKIAELKAPAAQVQQPSVSTEEKPKISAIREKHFRLDGKFLLHWQRKRSPHLFLGLLGW
jgi:hypothetical protein